MRFQCKNSSLLSTNTDLLSYPCHFLLLSFVTANQSAEKLRPHHSWVTSHVSLTSHVVWKPHRKLCSVSRTWSDSCLSLLTPTDHSWMQIRLAGGCSTAGLSEVSLYSVQSSSYLVHAMGSLLILSAYWWGFLRKTNSRIKNWLKISSRIRVQLPSV